MKKGDIKKATQCPNKSKIKFINHAKKKPLLKQWLCLHPLERVDSKTYP